MSDRSTSEPLSRRGLVLVVLLLAFLGLKLVHGAIVLTPTFDEYKHSLSGWLYLKTGICCKGQSDTALVALNGLPWLLAGEIPLAAPREGQPFDWGSESDRYPPVHWRNTLARLPNVALALLLASLIFRAAWAMGGEIAGLTALALACACPNLTGHGMLVSTDAQGAFGYFAGVLGFAAWLQRGMRWRGLALAVLGFFLAQISKYTCLLLVPSLAVIALACGGPGLRERLTAALKTMLVFAAGFALVLAVYELPARWAGDTPLTAEVLSPPGHRGYLGGLELPLAMGQYGVPGYFLGEFGTTWPLFYLTAVLVKTPITILVAAALGLVALWRGPFGWRNRLLLLLPPAILFAASSLGKVTFALRYVLAIYPFLLVLGGLFVHLLPSRWRGGVAVAVGLLALGEGSWLHPHELAYFNAAVGGPRHGPEYFLDSNIDWGQDLGQLASELKRRGIDRVHLSYHGSIRPEIYRIDYVPLEPRKRVSGWVAISVTHLFGLYVPRIPQHDADAYAWLRELEPETVIGGSIYLYRVPEGPPSERR